MGNFEKRNVEGEKRVNQAISLLIDEVNGNRDSSDLIAKAIMNNHRTLQASLWRDIVKAMAIYGETEYFDLRNKGAVDMCKKISDFATDPENEIYVPYV